MFISIHARTKLARGRSDLPRFGEVAALDRLSALGLRSGSAKALFGDQIGGQLEGQGYYAIDDAIGQYCSQNLVGGYSTCKRPDEYRFGYAQSSRYMRNHRRNAAKKQNPQNGCVLNLLP